MYVLGIDPGSAHCAWAVVECSAGAQPRVLTHGAIDPAETWVGVRRVLRCWPLLGCAAVEVPRLCGPATQQLIDTAIVAGRIMGVLESEHIAVRRCTSWQWRSHVVGVSGAKDREVKAALTALLPVLPRCSAHVRDAIGVALWAGGQP